VHLTLLNMLNTIPSNVLLAIPKPVTSKANSKKMPNPAPKAIDIPIIVFS